MIQNNRLGSRDKVPGGLRAKPSLINLMIVLLFVITACGKKSGDADEPVSSLSGVAELSLKIQKDSDFDPDVSGNIETSFRMTVSGQGVATQVYFYDAETRQARIEGLPLRSVVDVTVEAINADGYVVKRGYAENIAIKSAIQEAILNIVRVPIFTNVNDRSTLLATRLRFKTLAEPGHSLALHAQEAGMKAIAVRSLSGATQFAVSSRGEVDIDPVNLKPGSYALVLKDVDNGEVTERSVVIHPGVPSEPFEFTAGATLGSMRYADESSSTSLVEVLYP